jgi:DNA helicase-2/ATP-dependent DNA helicase PcrA
VLAWIRLLTDPSDAAAVVRALARPPIELHQVELARVIQVARRRKLDLVSGLAAAIESPQVPPEARERIHRFLALHASAAANLDNAAPEVFLARLIELLDTAPERLGSKAGEGDGDGDGDGELHTTFELLREEVLDGVARIGGRLGELRFDTDLDISHGVVRYMELLKVAALLRRAPGQRLEDALADVNARLQAAATPLQREILQTSTLDLRLTGGDARPTGDGRRPATLASREQHSLTPFLPRKGAGLALSASDIQTYRTCPLRYKFARVLRIPTEQTVNQRFGIVVHQVLERYHRDGGETLAQMLALLDGCWRRAGFGEDGLDEELLEKARVALTRYHERLRSAEAQPVWFERAFQFQLGPHYLRGRVDRVDRLGEGEDAEYELIDYKTSRPKDAEQLHDDVQLSLYALAARKDWRLPHTSLAYYYVLDDLKVPVPSEGRDPKALEGLVIEVGEGILAQEFEPKPSPSVCSGCDYRIVCPAAGS